MNCRSCGAAIIWAVTTNGKSMPLDKAPRHDGNMVLRGPNAAGIAIAVPVSRLVAVDLKPGEVAYVSHFATCPNATAHRKPR